MYSESEVYSAYELEYQECNAFHVIQIEQNPCHVAAMNSPGRLGQEREKTDRRDFDVHDGAEIGQPGTLPLARRVGISHDHECDAEAFYGRDEIGGESKYEQEGVPGFQDSAGGW